MWRVVGVRVGLLCHDREVEGVVVKDDTVWNSASVAAHAKLRCMSQKDEAAIVFHEYFNAGCVLRSAVDFFEKGHHRGPHGSIG